MKILNADKNKVHLSFYNFERFTLENLNIWKTTIEDWITVGEVHVVHYENVLEERMMEIEKILQFLQITIQEWRLSCVKYCSMDMYLRKNGTQSESSPFSNWLKVHVWETILEVNDMLINHGHESLPLDKYTLP